jgi:hypothetical protein
MSGYASSIREAADRHGWTVVEEHGALAVHSHPYPVEVSYEDEDGNPQVRVEQRTQVVRHRLGGLAEQAYDARRELTELAGWYAESGYRDVVQVLESGAP